MHKLMQLNGSLKDITHTGDSRFSIFHFLYRLALVKQMMNFSFFVTANDMMSSFSYVNVYNCDGGDDCGSDDVNDVDICVADTNDVLCFC